MPLRTFVDSAGNEWQAFDVVPRSDERRHYDRRVSGQLDSEIDDRRDEDRRVTVGGSGVPLRDTSGWLCFERGAERRRLTPIPEEWTRASDEELDAYCQAARPVRRDSAEIEPITDKAR